MQKQSKLNTFLVSVIIMVIVLCCSSQVQAVQDGANISTVTAGEAQINIGDYIQMGKYYDEPILWRCVNIDENGPLMLADKILTLKPFDAAGSHKYLDGTAQANNISNDRTTYGSNIWETSNMRSWLNSTATAGNVPWPDGCPPTNEKVWNGYNDYATEKGFLAEGNFTSTELNAIKSVNQKSVINDIDVPKLCTGGTAIHKNDVAISTVVQNYDTAYYHNVTDKMFLLDVKQVNKVYSNSTILGTNYYIGEPTEKAVNNSEYTNSALTASSNWHYWLRTPLCEFYNGRFVSVVRSVHSDGIVFNNNANGIDGNCLSLGVRPAFYLNLLDVNFISGNGMKDTPYVVENDITAPSWPDGSTITASDVTENSLTLAWPEATDNVAVNSYNVYNGSILIETVSSSSLTYNVSGLVAGTTYTLTVQASDAAGNSSNDGPTISVNTLDITAPTWPDESILSASNLTENSLILIWPKATDCVGVTGYEVYQGGSLLGTVNDGTLTYYVSGLTANTQYTFTVRACDASRNRNELTAMVKTFPELYVTGTVPGDKNIVITFNKPIAIGNATAFRNISLKNNLGQAVTISKIISSNTLIITPKKTLASSTEYTVLIPAPAVQDAAGNCLTEAYSFSFTSTQQLVKPAAPSNVAVAVIDSTRLLISWNEVSGATSYNIYRATSKKGKYTKIASVSVPETTYTDQGLTASETYWYYIKAVNSIGEGAASTKVSGTTVSF